MREFYVFGSVCRGEPDLGSDVDVLVITDESRAKHDLPPVWSIYSPSRIRHLFSRGTLFAWHLHLEAVPVWPRTKATFLGKLGSPAPYVRGAAEIEELIVVLESAIRRIQGGTLSVVYEFGLLALACRDIAMAAAPSLTDGFDFSRHAPLQLRQPRFPLTRRDFDYLLDCRRATTRGGQFHRHMASESRIRKALPGLLKWGRSLLATVRK